MNSRRYPRDSHRAHLKVVPGEGGDPELLVLCGNPGCMRVRRHNQAPLLHIQVDDGDPPVIAAVVRCWKCGAPNVVVVTAPVLDQIEGLRP